VWLSEYGDSDAWGLAMSRRILEDMNGLHPTVWAYWQVVDSAGGWGFFKNALGSFSNTATQTNKKFHVMGQYSRFIRSGYTLIAIGDRNPLAALDKRSRTLVIVSTNSGDAAISQTYDLSGFSRLAPSASIVRTSATEDFASLPSVALRNKRLVAQLPPKSVSTFVVRDAFFRGALKTDFRAYHRISNEGTQQLSQNGPNQEIQTLPRH
jgi:hypothetical protein